MFTLLSNLYQYLRHKRERKLTFVVLGVDNAGKTTLLKSLKGDPDLEVSPTFGFGGTTILTEGQYTVSIYDVGGGKQLRRIWKTYLPEIHGAIFVVDASDQNRFEEAKSALQQTLEDVHLLDKPVLIFANKQDVPTSATAVQVASALGLASCKVEKFNLVPCIAKSENPAVSDARIQAGVKWLVSTVDDVFGKLNPRVVKEADVARQQEEKRKKEREERAKKMKEERLKLLKEEESAVPVAFQDLTHALSPSQDPLKEFCSQDSNPRLDQTAADGKHVAGEIHDLNGVHSCGDLPCPSEPWSGSMLVPHPSTEVDKDKHRWSHNKVLPYTDAVALNDAAG